MGKVALTVLTNSELNLFRTCRRKWAFAYEERLSPRRRPKALEVGSAVHGGMEAAYRLMRVWQGEGDRFDLDRLRAVGQAEVDLRVQRFIDALLQDERWFDLDTHEQEKVIAETEAAQREARTAFGLFAEAYAATDYQRFEVVEVETLFSVPLRDATGTKRARLLQRGRFDVVLRDRASGEIVLNEAKTTVQHAHELDARLDVDPQIPGYINALREMRPAEADRIGRVLLTVVRKKGPSIPELTTKGLVSAAQIDTTREIYGLALQEQLSRGLPITDAQQARFDGLPGGVARYVSRHEHFVSEEDVEQWRQDVVEDAKLIRAAQAGRLRLTRNGASCSVSFLPPCPYRSICVSDTPERRAASFIVREHRNEELVEDDS